jgi:hypothetical protein
MDDIEKILSDLSNSISSSALALKVHLKVADGAVKSRRLWLAHNLDDNSTQASVQYSPAIPPLLEEQVIRHTGRFGGFVGVAKQGVVTFAATYRHHAKPKEDRFGN